MNFFIFAFVVALCVTLGSSAELRKEQSIMTQLSQKHGKTMMKKGAYQNVVGTFPSNPSYAVMKAYADTNCGSNYMGGVSYLLDTCLAAQTTSVKYTCASGMLTTTDYSDITCTTVADTTTSAAVGTCSSGTDGSGELIACGTSDATSFGSNSVVQSYAQNSGCSETIGAVAFANGYCYDGSGGGVNISYSFKWPKAYMYGTSDCTGASSSETISTSCSTNPDATATDDAVAYNSYNSFSHVGSAFSNFSFGFGALISALVVVVQLMKN